MDNTRPTPPGTVQPTPEAGPVTPPTMQDHFAQPTSGTQSAAASQTEMTPEATVTAASAGTGSGNQQQGQQSGQTPDAAAQELGERLKPVLAAAEDVAVKALDLSAKGLSRLVDRLEERRRQRDSSESS